jgi:hypothetical protein
MENKYKVGDKVYFGYYTGDDIVVEEYEVITVYEDEIELRSTTTSSLIVLRPSWINDTNYFDTYEEAYNHAVKRVRATLIEDLAEIDEEVAILKKKIAEFEEKYGKGD